MVWVGRAGANLTVLLIVLKLGLAPAVTFTTSVMMALAPLLRLPTVHVNVPAGTLQPPWLGGGADVGGAAWNLIRNYDPAGRSRSRVTNGDGVGEVRSAGHRVLVRDFSNPRVGRIRNGRRCRRRVVA